MFRRRFRRFRRRPLVKARRPTWQQAWDFQNNFGNTEAHTPAAGFAVAPTSNDPRAVVSSYGTPANARSMVLQDFRSSGQPFFVPIIQESDLDFYEGELSLVRLLGHVRLHECFVMHDPGSDPTWVQQVEVRCAIYKTFEQTQNGITALCNPFLNADKDIRILWSASWISKLTVVESADIVTADQMGEDFRLAQHGAEVYNTPFSQRVASVRMRQAVKVKGNERVVMSFAMAPVETGYPQEFGIRVSGWGRALIKH